MESRAPSPQRLRQRLHLRAPTPTETDGEMVITEAVAHIWSNVLNQGRQPMLPTVRLAIANTTSNVGVLCRCVVCNAPPPQRLRIPPQRLHLRALTPTETDGEMVITEAVAHIWSNVLNQGRQPMLLTVRLAIANTTSNVGVLCRCVVCNAQQTWLCSRQVLHV